MSVRVAPIAFVLGAGVCGSMLLAQPPQAPLTVPLFQDGTAAGLPDGSTVYNLLAVRQTDAGAFFAGRIAGGGTTANTDSGVWIGSGAQQRLVLREGDPIPGSNPARVVGDLWTDAFYSISRSGQRIGLTANVRDPIGPVDTGIGVFSIPTNGMPLTLVARVGDSVPGITGATFSNIANAGESLGINDSGRVAFQAAIIGGAIAADADEVIVSNASGTLTVLAREGSPVPGLANVQYGSGFAAGQFTAPIIDNAGRVLVTLPLKGAGTTNSTNVGVFLFNNSTTPALLIRRGGQAPGFPAGTTIVNFTSRPFMTPGGSFSFRASVSGSNKNALFVWGNGGITRHLAEGDQAPGFAPGVVITSIFENSFVSDSGQIIVQGSTTVGTALWAGTLGNAALVAASGMTVPGVDFPGYITLTDARPDVNAAGEITFKARVQPAGGGDLYDALCAWDAKRGIRVIAQRGSQLTINGVGNPLISTVTLGSTPYFSNPTPYAGILDNAGAVTFAAGLQSYPNSTSVASNVRQAGRVPSLFGVESTLNLLWQQTSTLNGVMPGQVSTWFRNGAGTIESRAVGFVADTNWKLVGSADFDRDGTLDLVWHNLSTGTALLWLMNPGNGTVRTTLTIGSAGAGSNWRCRAVADMNLDGVPDLVWQDEVTATVGLWIMNAGGTSQSPTYSPTWKPIWSAVDANARPWRVVGAADFNADVVPDLLFRYEGNTQANLLGLMGVLTIRNDAVTGWFGINSVADLNWQVAGVNDVDGDGQQDILWRYVTGELYYWRMNGSRNLATVYIGWMNPAWTLVRASPTVGR